MLAYALRRCLTFGPLLVAIALITFTLSFYGPGDPLAVIMGENWTNEAVYQSLRHQYGLDRPFLIQFADYVGKAVQGDFGRSLILRVGVGDLMWNAWPITAQLALASIVLMAFMGVGLGALAALRRDSWLDHLIVTFGVTAHSIPTYVLAPIVLVLLVLQLHVIDVPTGWHGFLSYQTLLAALVLSIPSLLGIVRQTRNSIIDVLSQDYILTARAKGLPEPSVLWRHVLKNALTPVLTSLGITFGYLLGGAIFVESAFAIPGIGQLVFTALRTNDYPLLLGTTLVSTVGILTINLLVDLAYAWLDPRVRYR